MNREVVGVVLAGGESRRMGRDKALLDVEGSALVDRAAGVLGDVCARVALAVGPGRRYPGLDLEHVEDLRSDCGPLAALEAALAWAGGREVLALACDLPRVEAPVLERLLRQAAADPARGRAVAWPARRAGRTQPLCGLYSAACGQVFSRLLDSDRRAVSAALEAIECRPVTFDDLERDPFLNVNTPADYVKAGGRMATP